MIYIWFLVLLNFILFYRKFTGKKSSSVSCLVGKTAIVTVGNEGIGYQIAVLLASRGCKVIIADVANSEKSRDNIVELTKNENVLTKYLDLSSFASVRNFSEEIKVSESKIDILVNNAGINGTELHVTEDGLNNAMQVNYFGAFLLTHLLVDLMKRGSGARIVFAGSFFAHINKLSVHNLNGFNIPKNCLRGAFLYGNTKLCNILAAQEFGTRLKKYNITANAADPWVIETNIVNLKHEYKWFTIIKKIILLFLARDPQTGAQTAFHLVSSDEMEGKTGGSYVLCRKTFKPWKLGNPEFCKKIWEKSEELVNLRSEEKL